MAWQIKGPWINPGETWIHWFSFDDHAWKGIQVYAAKPVQTVQSSGGITVSFQFPSTLTVHDSEVLWTDEGYVYRVQVTNKGPEGTDYELWGTEA